MGMKRKPAFPSEYKSRLTGLPADGGSIIFCGLWTNFRTKENIRSKRMKGAYIMWCNDV